MYRWVRVPGNPNLITVPADKSHLSISAIRTYTRDASPLTDILRAVHEKCPRVGAEGRPVLCQTLSGWIAD